MRTFQSPFIRPSWPLAAAVAVLFAAPHAMAQEGPASTAAGALAPGRTAEASQQYHGLRATQVIGKSVRNPQGQNIGQVEDIVVNTGTGSVRYAMLRFDPGFLSGERLFAVPMDQLRMGAQRNDLVLAASRDRLERAAIARSAWNRDHFADLERIRRMDEAWGIRNTDTSPVARASDLIGREIRSRDGRRIGELEELVIDAGRQQVHYAIASFDNGWLDRDRRVALPLRTFYRHPSGDALTLNASREQVARMPDFDRRRYGSLDDPVFVAEIERYLVLVPMDPAQQSGAQPGARQGATRSTDPQAGAATSALGASAGAG